MIRRHAVFGLGVVIGGALIATFAAPTFAQSPTTPTTGGHRHGMGGGHMFANLAQELNLTADQKTKVQPILDNATAQMKAIRTDTSLSREDQRAKFGQIVQAAMAQIGPLLTPEQQKQLAAIHAHRGARGMGRGGGGNLAQMAQRLGLSSDQQSKIQAIMQNERTQVEQVRANTSLSAEQQQSRIASIRQAGMARIKSTLTPDQVSKLGQMRHHSRSAATAPSS